MTRAAEKLNLTQSALSKAILTSEGQINVKLFDRIPSGMRLTPQGERLYAFAEGILQQANNFEKAFYEKEGEIEGEIKIIATPFVGAEWLVPNLEEFLKKHPKIRVKIFLTSENINVREGDVTLCTLMPHNPYLIQKPLFTPRVRLFASPSYLKKHGTPQTLADLDNHYLITYRGNYFTTYGSTHWLLNLANHQGESPKESYFEINSLSGMLKSATCGYGIVELPDYSIVLNSGLVEVLPHIKGEEMPLYYSFLKNRKSSKKINALFNYLVKKGK